MDMGEHLEWRVHGLPGLVNIQKAIENDPFVVDLPSYKMVDPSIVMWQFPRGYFDILGLYHQTYSQNVKIIKHLQPLRGRTSNYITAILVRNQGMKLMGFDPWRHD